ncbi:MAG: Methyltransferase type 12 [Parcubacteria group bacterium GW2011_GWA2_56_7]|nr:MAG: Methyltransferase type 12 [Parcubacteria group bacterium GW2011_GWA2_56_7]
MGVIRDRTRDERVAREWFWYNRCVNQLLVTNKDGYREARLIGRVFYDGAWHDDGVVFKTTYTPETIDALYTAKGAYLYDEILRVEDEGYLKEQFIGFIKRQTTLAGKHVLDFGSGCGSSSILLAREGAMVTSVELMETYRTAAKLRVRERGPILRHLSSFLKPGGLLIVTETPNRLWPYDSHTTRLPFVSWLPLSLASALARVLRPREFGDKTRDDLIYDGIVGATWWGIVRALPRDVHSLPTPPRAEHRAYFARLRQRKTGVMRLAVELLTAKFFFLALFLNFFSKRVPINAFFPYLNIAFSKEGDTMRP